MHIGVLLWWEIRFTPPKVCFARFKAEHFEPLVSHFFGVKSIKSPNLNPSCETRKRLLRNEAASFDPMLPKHI
jgi:hypothetical protein